MNARRAFTGSLLLGAAFLTSASPSYAAPGGEAPADAPPAAEPAVGLPADVPAAAEPAARLPADAPATAEPSVRPPGATPPAGPGAGGAPVVWPGYRPAPGPRGYGEAHVEPPPVEEPTTPLPRTLDHRLQLDLGLRSVWIGHVGFEPYAGGDVNLLAQLALGATYLPFTIDPFTLGLGVEYDVGARSQRSRGQDCALTAHRLAGSVVGDFTLVRYVHLFARVAPAALYLHGSIQDAALPDRPLSSNAWTWGVDTTGGAAFMVGAVGDREAPDVGFWITAELGYSFAGKVAMSYAPTNDGEDPRRFGGIELPALRPSGITNRLTFGLSF
jgi:hypothetical protein